MSAPAATRRHRRSSREGAPATPRAEKLGEEALHFFRWFGKSKFQLMADFMAELQCSPTERDADELAGRFARAVTHAKRVLVLQSIVTVLLAAGVVATMGATLARLAPVPHALAGDVAAWLSFLDRAAAIAGSATILLVLLRLAFQRYLDLVDTSATFLAMQLVSARCAAR